MKESGLITLSWMRVKKVPPIIDYFDEGQIIDHNQAVNINAEIGRAEDLVTKYCNNCVYAIRRRSGLLMCTIRDPSAVLRCYKNASTNCFMAAIIDAQGARIIGIMNNAGFIPFSMNLFIRY